MVNTNIHLGKCRKPIFFLVSTAVLLFFYSIIVRSFNIYFFWEAVYLPKFFLYAAYLLFLLSQYAAMIKSKIKLLYLGITVVSFFVVFVFFVTLVQDFDEGARIAAKRWFSNNETVKKDLGNIRDMQFYLKGFYQKLGSASGDTGEATYEVLVKGSLKFKEYHMAMELSDTNWVVVSCK